VFEGGEVFSGIDSLCAKMDVSGEERRVGLSP
jgi:hypothetical protein